MAFRDTPSSSLGEQSDPHPLDLPCPSRSCGAPSTAGSSVCPGVLIAHAPPPPLVHTHTPLRGPLSGSETQRQGPGLSVLGGASVPQPPPAPRTWPTLCPALSRTPQEVQGFTVPQELVDTYPSPLRWDDAGVGPTRLSQLPQQDWLQLPTVVGVCAPTLELVLEALSLGMLLGFPC